MPDRTQCTLVKMSNMPYAAEPAWIFTRILARNPAIQEIEMASSGYYCYVDTLANAQAIATQHDQQGVLAEYPHAYKVIGVEVIPMRQVSESVALRLSDFLRAEREMRRTKTVQFRGLPRGTPTRNIMEMSEKCFEYARNLDDYFYSTTHASSDTNPRAIEIKAFDGEALVRFSSEQAAAWMVSEYNGNFWKNDVVYAEFVADSELVVQANKLKCRQTKLFIPKVKPGASKEDVRAVFSPHECQDIQMPPGKPFAFVFMHQDAATRFLNALERRDGKRHDGWFWVIKTDKK